MEESRIARIFLAILSGLLVMVALDVLAYLSGEIFNYSVNRVFILILVPIISVILGIGVYLQKTWAVIACGIFMVMIGGSLIIFSTIDFIQTFTSSNHISGIENAFAGEEPYFFLLTLGVGLIASGIAYITKYKVKI
jgi:hypothetical protein